ncbi:cyclic nucleotide-binding domain-containing protein [Candidatus Venteria ishoeyi]|uniref:Cyclic nucleotide-binding domain protein n=1 Tax=Candidatus Venteria ishoeyi TaxID=1899563 RepID=A0A1H6FDY8_9GAMM|nr:cyclic nucleotide-binding domain-containing protein [Candidatus Venteria ishoeyi]MDM8546669.1 cyclic nucleotide-binding domain-containing protein [Candidatus Venteria ishoeyi]SEH07621.1 Cyclic nucleotide-binding domain protein [Candidatus Venteria ishoeyi]
MYQERRALSIAIFFNILIWASVTLSRTYIDVLFLSTYDTALLPGFFTAQTLLILSLSIAITPFAAKGSSWLNISIFMAMALLVLLGHYLLTAYPALRSEASWFPFIFTLWLSAIPVLLIVLSLNVIADAFDVRRFKRLVIWINVVGNIGGLLTGLLIPKLINNYGASTLLVLLVSFIALATLCLFFLKPLPVATRNYSKGQSPFNYPLFRYIALCTFLLMVVDILTDYALKVELAAMFTDKEDIGSFMGPFYGLSNILMLAAQIIGTQRLLHVFGVAGLLSVIPWFCMGSSVLLMAIPHLWTAALIRMGETVFRFSFYSIGREIALKPLPAKIRRGGKFLNTAAGYLGAGITAIILWIMGDSLNLVMVGGLIITASIVWLIVARRVTASYQDTLEEAIRIKRFSLSSDEIDTGHVVPGDDSNRDNMLHITKIAFKDKDVDIIRFGFTLLARTQATCLPEEAYPHVNAADYDVRVDFVQAAYQLKDQRVVPLLLARLEVEEDGKVLWWLLKILAHLAPEEVASIAPRWLNSPLPLARAGAVLVLLSNGTLNDLTRAVNTLQVMLSSPDEAMRRGAAYAISASKVGNLEAELEKLLHDPVEAVSIAAMWAVADKKYLHLLPVLAEKLGKGRSSLYASRTLVQLGVPALPHVLKVIEDGSQIAARTGVRILTMIHDEKADEAIVQVAKNGNVITRTFLAKACSMRTKQQENTDYLVKQARLSVQEEANTVRLLRALNCAEELPVHSRYEISQRKKMAEARLLYWFDVATCSVELSGVIPSLLQDNTSQAIASRHATALEFLEGQTKDKLLLKAILVFEENTQKISREDIEAAILAVPTLNDLWLEKFIGIEHGWQYHKGKNMEITEKVMLLRRVKLFADLPGEILLTIAETCEDRELVKDEVLFSKGDAPDGMYIVAAGEVQIRQDKEVINTLKQYDFFGELGLFDDSPRMADAIASGDGMILFLQKEVFDGITEDLPEVLRALVKTVISYLK